MKRTLAFLLTLLIVGVAAVASCAQSRTNRITRPCPNTATPARVEVQLDGDIDLVPCSGRNVYINGVLTSNTITFSGSSRTNFFPVFSTETNLAKSPFSWDGTDYFLNNTALNATFLFNFRPGTGSNGFFELGDSNTVANGYMFLGGNFAVNVAGNSNIDAGIHSLRGPGNIGDFTLTMNTSSVAGRFQVGDLVNNDDYFDLSDATGNADWTMSSQLSINAPQIILGSGTNVTQIQFATSATSPSYTFNRTITAGGTTGNRTINKPVGTVNFAAAATAITVTNSTVTTNSIIFAMARTNDATCAVKNVVPGAGSFVINMTAACTAETSVGFLVTN